jgi:vibriolysin
MRNTTLRTLLAGAVAAIACQAGAAEIRDVAALIATVESIQESGGTPESLGASTASAIGLDEASDLDVLTVRDLPDDLGRVVRFQQTLNGIPVWNQQVLVEQDASGQTINLQGTAVFDIAPEESGAADPALSPEEALERAREAVTRENVRAPISPEESGGALAPFENEEAQLVYFVDGESNLHLSYATSFFTTVIDSGGGIKPTRPVLIIDAQTGETLDHYENIQFIESGTGPGGNTKVGQYQWGTGVPPKYEVEEQGADCRMDSTILKTEDLNHGVSGSGAPYQFTCHENLHKQINGASSPLNDAQGYGKVVFDMFDAWYNTSPLTNKLHMRVHYSSNYENAFWNGQQMTFGDGATRFHPLVSLDVSAHEVAHGFTEQNSGLVYRDESGGMNEAFSDMAGEAAEFYFAQTYGQLFSNRTMPDLNTGADIFKGADQSLRYMCDPPRDGRSIGHLRDYRAGMDVHYSSGIYNKAFCILSKRPGWDVKKAFDIFVFANQNYWVPNETFTAGARKVLDATRRLQYAEGDVIHAFREVGIELAPPKRYLYTTLRVITSGANRGCAVNDWNCMTRLCKADLADQSAWRGWAGCWRDGSNYICNFECGQTRNFY